MVSAVPLPIILPTTFNDDNNVEALDTSKLEKFVLLNIDVDVACKFDIFNDEYDDKWFKFVIVELPVNEFIIFNNVVDVAFKLLIDKVDDDDKLFKLLKILVDVLFKLLIDNIELVDRLLKLLKIVVDVLFKLLIDNIEFVDKLFKLVISAYPDKSGLFSIAL